jgi:hypothetical protein
VPPLQPSTAEDFPEWQSTDTPSALPGGQMSATTNPRTGRPLLQVVPAPSSGLPQSAEDMPEWKPSEQAPPDREVGQGEAALTGLKSGLTFGFAPALEAGNEVLKHFGYHPEDLPYVPEAVTGAVGSAIRLKDWATGHDDPEVAAAYERGRQHAEKNVDLAKEQHPVAFYSGLIGGSLLLPGLGPELGAAGALGRVATGLRTGAVYGGLQGTGEAVSRGESLPEVAKSAGKGVVVGGVTGGALHGAVGPREPPLVPTGGQRAAETAQDLGTPLPRGVVSDSPVIQRSTAAAQSLPLTGARITGAVRRTQEAAGEHVGDVSSQMTRGAAGRSAADASVRSGLGGVVNRNRNAQNAGYNRLRAMLPGNGDTSVHAMPRTQAALDAIVAARRSAGWANPEQGLEQFRNVSRGATFNGAHRARVDARDAGKAGVANPGYNAADYNRITRAMTADLRTVVQQGAVANAHSPQQALRAFEEAEATFGRLAEQNRALQGLIDAGGESAIARLMGAAKEKGGDARLLQQLRRQMTPQEFEHIGGTLLSELGQRQGEFSLQQFATNWEKLSQPARAALFSPRHLSDINDIVAMGQHINRALEATNRSHSGTVLVAFEMLKSAAETAIAAGAGWITAGELAAGVSGVALPQVIGMILASPARAASTRAWLTAYRNFIADATPARAAVFKVATRNLGNTLGVPAEKVAQIAEDATPPQKQQVEVPIR